MEAVLIRAIRRATAIVVVFLTMMADAVVGDPVGLNNMLIVAGYFGGLIYLGASLTRQLYGCIVEDENQ